MVPPSDSEVLRLRQSVSAMGTTFSIALHGRDRDRMEAAVRAAFDEVRRLDRLLSSYRADSECEPRQPPGRASPGCGIP